MDVRRDTCCSVGNRRRRDSWASSCSERSEDEDRRDQGVAMTIVTLNAILDDNNRMFEFLRSFGVLGDKYICAKCRKLMSCAKVPPKRCRDLLMWRCRKDDVWRSVRKGTWFETARLSIRTIVLMSYCFCMRKSVVSTSRMTGLSERSVGDWFLSCREICSALLKKRGKIGGPGVVVEMGESCFGVAENRKGKWLPELWVWGAVVCGKERGDLVLKIVDKRDARTLQRLLEEHVEDGTVICSDTWKSYEDEGAVDLQTFADDHNYQFHNKVIGTMEQCWEEVKRVLGRGKRRRSGLQSHLDEYVWRESVFGNGQSHDDSRRERMPYTVIRGSVLANGSPRLYTSNSRAIPVTVSNRSIFNSSTCNELYSAAKGNTYEAQKMCRMRVFLVTQILSERRSWGYNVFLLFICQVWNTSTKTLEAVVLKLSICDGAFLVCTASFSTRH
ncbi:uncharacterized protein LOC124553849 isoform X2 [Schistocerca americana]|uniref:uncharacterized protein LOC124553849 isoform X2 n=1 Tax=Schistocerca americana TaxID=7009 RepID=UPI001F502309|nr:uncharacterized protein LOC124553849 isoform X2 [Schistocerca americana]XP_046983798.1 uncharacterized protein LOC124553849 isoform X2 [Schistocerca americana]XP_046983799.1 uncharacterized protein LOC124553849 isoform X2 [Schistocerca americana]XP_046983800.1 uncharacterized protein LOC124553849 isoform X2 [Schistocerca americana]